MTLRDTPADYRSHTRMVGNQQARHKLSLRVTPLNAVAESLHEGIPRVPLAVSGARKVARASPLQAPSARGLTDRLWFDPNSAGTRALCCRIDRVDRLARGHKQPVALRTAEADIAADLRQADAADEFTFGIPYRHAVVADCAAGIARHP